MGRRCTPLLLALGDPPEAELGAGAAGVQGKRGSELALRVGFLPGRHEDFRQQAVRVAAPGVEVRGAAGVRHRAREISGGERLVGGLDQGEDVHHRCDRSGRAGRCGTGSRCGTGFRGRGRRRSPDLGPHRLSEAREVRAVEVGDDDEVGLRGVRRPEAVTGALRVAGDEVGPGAVQVEVALALGGRFGGVRNASVLLGRLAKTPGVESALRFGLELRGLLRDADRRYEEEPAEERERAAQTRRRSRPHCSIPCSTATGAGGVHGASPRSGIVICWVAGWKPSRWSVTL